MKMPQINHSNLMLKVSEKKKEALIHKWGIGEAKLIIAAAENVTKDALARRSTADEIAEFISENFTTDPTHMSDEVLVEHLNRLAVRAENDLISRGA